MRHANDLKTRVVLDELHIKLMLKIRILYSSYYRNISGSSASDIAQIYVLKILCDVLRNLPANLMQSTSRAQKMFSIFCLHSTIVLNKHPFIAVSLVSIVSGQEKYCTIFMKITNYWAHNKQ